MSILVAGLINIETTLRVEGFPISYQPQHFPFHGIDTTVSGVGYNVAKALHTLGERVTFLSIVGNDFAGRLAREALKKTGVSEQFIVSGMPRTAQSVILYDPSGQRQAHTDLKNIQETDYPVERFRLALAGCDLAALCNINFARPFLGLAKAAGKRIATDVHNISDLDDPYNADFMRAADILFMSDERLPCAPREWVRRVQGRYDSEIVVVGLGAKGALLAVKSDHSVRHFPAVQTRPVVSTIGAGDALFSCFVHAYRQTGDPYRSLQLATLFASWKIGEAGAADGFLDTKELERLAA